MENASKALIIAGAILLAILIISLGIMIFNQAQDTIKGGGMSKAEIQMYNATFLKYEGQQKGSSVKSLIQEVNASNVSNKQENEERPITIETDSVTIEGSTDGTYKTKDIASSKIYIVTITSYHKSGYIEKIKVEPLNK